MATDVDNIMTLHTSCSSTDFQLHQKLIAANSLALAHIAKGASLPQTLTSIVNGIEDQFPEIRGAIVLLNESGNQFSLGAAPSLHPDYKRAIEGIATEPEVWPHLSPKDTSLQSTAPPLETSQFQINAQAIEASPFWSTFRDLALQHGLYVCSATPIPSAADDILGIFVAYSRRTNQVHDPHQYRCAISDTMALASIAIERSINEAKIKKAENTLRDSETRMALAIEGSGTGIWDRNVVTGEIHYSTRWKAILGYTDSELTSRIEDSYTRVHPDDLAYVQRTIQEHFDQKTESYEVEHRIRCKDGSYKWISSRGKVVSRDAEGKPLRMIGTTTDITAMRALSDRLQQSVNLITSLTNEVPGLVYQYRLLPNGEAAFSYVSEGIRDIYEMTPEQLADNASLIHDIIHPEDFPNYRASLDASAATLMPWHLEYRVILPKQGLRWRHGDARPCRLQDGSTLWHGFITDVTERKRIEIELQEFATIDFLTQLPNRRHFMARMEEELSLIQNVPDTHTAVLMCDLDHFKLINDSYGHAVGDLVLKHCAAILRRELRKSDFVGRVGGEEFAIVLPGVGFAEANIFARRVLKQIAQTPLTEGGKTISMTASIGISVMKKIDTSADASLSRSDMALYRAKKQGRNRIEIAVN